MMSARRSLWFVLALVLALLVGRGCASRSTTTGAIHPDTAAQPGAKDFALRLQQYVKDTEPLRKSAEGKVPKGSTPEEQAKALEKQAALLADSIRALRAQAKPGDLLSADGTALIRRQIETAFSSGGAATIRDALEEQNDPSIYKGPSPGPVMNSVLLAPLVPAVLIPDLPQVPEQVEYLFAGRALVLTDAQTSLVLDYIADAFPEPPPTSPAAPAAPAAEAPSRRTAVFLQMPARSRSVRFAVLGDMGTGDASQQKVADTLWDFYMQDNRFKFVLMLGDNLYAPFESAADYRYQFLDPYKRFLDARVKFRAALGNHDRVSQADFAPFSMGGHPYYSFKEGNAKFVALNSNEPTNPEQLAWFDKQFAGDKEWRICFFHHPLYSSGTHARESREMRTLLEDRLIKNHVNVVFSGHEHFYERLKPQHDIHYFVCGAAAKLRRGDLHPQEFTAFGYDRENSLMIIEIAGDDMFFQTLGVSGRTIDCGVVYRTPQAAAKNADDAATRQWLDACGKARAWLSPVAKPLGGEKATGSPGM